MSVPAVDLHCHLDASMRISTIEDLAARAGLEYDRPIPELATVPQDCESLVEFLAAIDVQVDVLQDVDAIERAAFELVEDFHADGVIHGEIRFAPHLHQRNGVQLDDIIDAAHQGARRGADKTAVSTSIILCVLRHRDPRQGDELIEAIDRLPGRVQGVDIAGPEAGHPAAPFGGFFAAASDRGLGITIHAGEAAGPASVWEALDMGATRIGHGVRSVRDPELVATLAQRRTTLECCPTGNVLTTAVDRIDAHPIDELHRAGVPTTVNTDARTSIPTTIGDELALLDRTFGWDRDRVTAAQLAAADAAFLDPAQRRELRAKIISTP